MENLCRSLNNLNVVLKETSKMSLGLKKKNVSGRVYPFVLRTLNMAILLSIRRRALDEKALDLLSPPYFHSWEFIGSWKFEGSHSSYSSHDYSHKTMTKNLEGP